VRITIIGPAYPFRGGIAHHVYYLKTELAGRKHDVQVINYKNLYPTSLFPGTTTIDSSSLALDPLGLAIIDPTNPLTWLKALKTVRAFLPDLVVIQWWNPFFAPAIGTLGYLLKGAGLKSVVECHNVFPHERSFLDFPLVDFAFAPFRMFVTHSTENRDLLVETFSGKSATVVPLPPPAFLSKDLPAPRTGRRMLFFGMVREYKGLEVLLAAMPKALERVECKLLIAGEFYVPVENYINIIKQRGLEEFVEIQNRYVPNEEIDHLLDNADVLVMPYLSATQSGIVQMARQRALPVIATRTGGLAEAVVENETGLLCDPGDPKSLAEAIVSYFKGDMGPELSSRMIQQIDSKSASQLCLLIERLAGEHQ